MRRLLQDIKVTFYRPPEGNVVDEYGDFAPSTFAQAEGIEVMGSLQPYRLGEDTLVLPENLSFTEARIFLTKTKLNLPDNDISPDFCVINGKKFIVFNKADATTTSILKRVSNYEYILVQDTSHAGEEFVAVGDGLWQQGLWTYAGVWDNTEVWGS